MHGCVYVFVEQGRLYLAMCVDCGCVTVCIGIGVVQTGAKAGNSCDGVQWVVCVSGGVVVCGGLWRWCSGVWRLCSGVWRWCSGVWRCVVVCGGVWWGVEVV